MTLDPSSKPYERDIPVPVGFRLIDRSSEDWSNGRLRFIRHHYEGSGDKYTVRRFYREQMPLVRWSLISEGNVHGRHRLDFQRAGESCMIYIEDGGGVWTRSVSIMVTIAPMDDRRLRDASERG